MKYKRAIQGIPLVPLPTEYWSRPIYATNYQWAKLGGNWWGLGKPSFTDTGGYDAQGNNFNPYTLAPNSAHIMWVKPTAFGGQVGLPISGDQESQYTSTSILYRQFEPIILNGIIYYKLYPNVPTTVTSAGGTPGWAAVDLRTGETLWTQRHQRHTGLWLGNAIPHSTRIWNTSIPSRNRTKRRHMVRTHTTYGDSSTQ